MEYDIVKVIDTHIGNAVFTPTVEGVAHNIALDEPHLVNTITTGMIQIRLKEHGYGR